jgi:hypothetical protein
MQRGKTPDWDTLAATGSLPEGDVLRVRDPFSVFNPTVQMPTDFNIGPGGSYGQVGQAAGGVQLQGIGQYQNQPLQQSPTLQQDFGMPGQITPTTPMPAPVTSPIKPLQPIPTQASTAGLVSSSVGGYNGGYSDGGSGGYSGGGYTDTSNLPSSLPTFGGTQYVPGVPSFAEGSEGMVNNPVFMTGDNPGENPFGGGAKPEIVVNPTQAPVAVLNNEQTKNLDFGNPMRNKFGNQSNLTQRISNIFGDTNNRYNPTYPRTGGIDPREGRAKPLPYNPGVERPMNPEGTFQDTRFRGDPDAPPPPPQGPIDINPGQFMGGNGRLANFWNDVNAYIQNPVWQPQVPTQGTGYGGGSPVFTQNPMTQWGLPIQGYYAYEFNNPNNFEQNPYQQADFGRPPTQGYSYQTPGGNPPAGPYTGPFNPNDPTVAAWQQQMSNYQGMPAYGNGTIPRYAGGTTTNGDPTGPLTIPSSQNPWAANMNYIPDRARMLMNQGMPMAPSTLNAISGNVNSPLNTASAVAQRGGGVLPSAQTLSGMTDSELKSLQGFYEGPVGIGWTDIVDYITGATRGLGKAQQSSRII